MASDPALTFDEADDILYFTRVNERADLEQTISELAQKYQTQPSAILEASADPENGNTPLHYCAANGHAELLTTLLNHLQPTSPTAAALLSRQNKEGSTPLHWAALNGHLAVVKTLVEAGADMWVKNSAGHLAMFEAERNEKSEVVGYLLEAGGKDVEKVGAEGAAADEELKEMDQEDEVVMRAGAAEGSGSGSGQTG
ncbi:hypothetical protein MBLNU230_g0446t1 [Neophaeotheca triangularis]